MTALTATGWFNFEFEKVSFFGTSKNAHMVKFSPLDEDEGRMRMERCSFDNLVPALDKFIWCILLLFSVAFLRYLLSLLLTKFLKKDLPASMKFPSWEAPVILVEYMAICSSAFLAVSTSCNKWIAVGCVLLVFWPLLLLVCSSLVLSWHVQLAHIQYESYHSKAEPAKVPPSFSEMKKSLDQTKGIVPNLLKMRAWFLAAEVRGGWKDGSIDGFGWKFLVGDYVGSAWFFGIWMMAKRILFLAATTALDGHENAIVCIVVQTLDLFFVLGLRPYVSKLVCISECLASITNWLAILNLGLLLWPGSTPLELGEMTVFILAIAGTGLATLVASVESLMASLIVIWNILAGVGTCMGISGTCWMATQSEIMLCCFGISLKDTAENEDEPIFLTSIACDWDQSQQPTDVTQSMGWQPITSISPTGIPQTPGSPQDPVALAVYYQQLADYHQMLSVQANLNGRKSSSPSMISPVSMSTAPTNFYNPTTVFFADAPTQLQAGPHHVVGTLPVFGNPEDLQKSGFSEEPKVSVSASLFHHVQSPPAATMFSRRSTPRDVRDDYVDGASLSNVPPSLLAGSNRVNGTGVPTLPLVSMPIQSSRHLASISPESFPRSTDPNWNGGGGEDVSLTLNNRHLDSSSASPSKQAMTRSMAPTSPRVYDYHNNDHQDNGFGYNSAIRPVAVSMSQRTSPSPRKLPDRDSPQPLQSHSSKRADELREGITRRAEALRQQLSTDRCVSPLSSVSSASDSPVYARGTLFGPSTGLLTQLSSARDSQGTNNDITPARVLISGLMSSHLVASPMSPSPSTATRNDAQSARRDLMSYLQSGNVGLRQNLLDVTTMNLPPAPGYPAPPPPPGQSEPSPAFVGMSTYGYGSDNDWDSGFG